MFNYKLVVTSFFLITLYGCTPKDTGHEALRTGYALPGTNTVVVGIGIDKDGIPKETYKDVVAHPGQKVLYAGPDEFEIIFKNRKTPNGQVVNPSSNGVVVIEIPKDILDRKEFSEELKKNDQIVFDYGIKANGKELDPPLIIRRGDN